MTRCVLCPSPQPAQYIYHISQAMMQLLPPYTVFGFFPVEPNSLAYCHIQLCHTELVLFCPFCFRPGCFRNIKLIYAYTTLLQYFPTGVENQAANYICSCHGNYVLFPGHCILLKAEHNPTLETAKSASMGIQGMSEICSPYSRAGFPRHSSHGHKTHKNKSHWLQDDTEMFS